VHRLLFRNKNSPAGRRDLNWAEGEHDALGSRRQAKLLSGKPLVDGFWGKGCPPARSIDQLRYLMGTAPSDTRSHNSIARRFGVKAAIYCHPVIQPGLLRILLLTASQSRPHDVKQHWNCFLCLAHLFRTEPLKGSA